ncbi:DUF4083 family protein [Bacillus sp. 03113]|uniref:DUF4083 family protein n=1 Tax=Bacillus sp. 03113 TaxID=2578211 RepID=UPI001143421A|nr:DUF4083 family protein [Bacillus sp. 03113]
MVNYGDIIFQFIMLIILLTIIIVIFYFIKSIFTNKSAIQRSIIIEKKLDRILELLEKDKKN